MRSATPLSKNSQHRTGGNRSKTKHRLAIVIPAFKRRFLRETLDALSMQTDRRFRLYVGDDASPEELDQVCDGYKDALDLRYTRFQENIGKSSLVQHWNRCVRLSREPWCWLLCDDDIPTSDCVAAFYREIEHSRRYFSVYRFNTSIVDAKDNILRINPDHPEVESGVAFAISRFKRERLSFVSEYIFSRQVFDKEGGFINFPMAWCSDDASWVAFSGSHGIYTIRGPRVLWRYSGLNISTAGNRYQMEKINAALEYIKWFENRLNQQNGIALNKHDLIMREVHEYEWLKHQLFLVSPLSFGNYFKVFIRIRKNFKKSVLPLLLDFAVVEIKSYKPFIRHIFLDLKNI